MKKIATTILVSVFCLFLVTPTFATNIVDSGNCGENVTWTLTDDGTLTINGSGPMYDYYNQDQGPWFARSNYVEKVVIKEGVTTIGGSAFSKAWSLNMDTTSISIPESCTEIGRSAFTGCYGLTEINIPSSVTKIDATAFCLCVNIKTITIPNGVTTISAATFAGCRNLTTVYLPAGINEIESEAFSNTPNLKNVYFAGTESQWRAITISEKKNSDLFAATIHYTSNPVPSPAPDVPSAWAVPEVNAAIAAGLVPADIQQDYTKPISRLKTVQLFMAMMEQIYGKEIGGVLADMGTIVRPETFTDTTDGAVLAANALGIIKGVGDNRFDPTSTLTRAQAAAMVNRMANVRGVDTAGYTHNFTDSINHWVSPELGWPTHTGIIKGMSASQFGPNNQLTTEQAIAIAYRTFNVLK